MEARHDEGVANRIGPEQCTGTHQQCAFHYRPEGGAKPAAFSRCVMKGPGIAGDRIETGVAPGGTPCAGSIALQL
jgi:hypothetical protein